MIGGAGLKPETRHPQSSQMSLRSCFGPAGVGHGKASVWICFDYTLQVAAHTTSAPVNNDSHVENVQI